MPLPNCTGDRVSIGDEVTIGSACHWGRTWNVDESKARGKSGRWLCFWHNTENLTGKPCPSTQTDANANGWDQSSLCQLSRCVCALASRRKTTTKHKQQRKNKTGEKNDSGFTSIKGGGCLLDCGSWVPSALAVKMRLGIVHVISWQQRCKQKQQRVRDVDSHYTSYKRHVMLFKNLHINRQQNNFGTQTERCTVNRTV